jgi:hypothetical protein
MGALWRQEPAVDFSERAGVSSRLRLDASALEGGETAGSVTGPVDGTVISQLSDMPRAASPGAEIRAGKSCDF